VTTHSLKLWPEYFDLVLAGTKTAELRRDDRGFAVGDTLHLREWDEFDGYSGRELTVTVTHVLRDFHGLAPGFALLSFTAPRPPEASRRVRVPPPACRCEDCQPDDDAPKGGPR
jgi:hypothetical protein